VAVVSEAQAAREAMERTRSAPQGLIRVSCPVGILHSDVGPILARYLADNPMVRINLEATNRRVDVVEEGFDLAFRVRLPPLEDSDLALRQLGTSGVLLACSPWFIAQHGRPQSVEDLAKMPTLSQARPGDRFVWHFTAPDGSDVSVTPTPRLITDDLATLRTAALAGIGIAQIPKELIREELAEGALVQVLPELKFPSRIVHVVFASRRGLIPAVRGLIDALVSGFEASADRN
jgi:DNA-binding transcriptional LysR family regulator